MRAVAYWVTTHSKRFGAQMPTRSPLLHAAREQRARGAVDLVPQLAVGRAVALVADDERLAVAEALDGAAQVLADRLAEQRDVARPVGVGEADRSEHAGGPAAREGLLGSMGESWKRELRTAR